MYSHMSYVGAEERDKMLQDITRTSHRDLDDELIRRHADYHNEKMILDNHHLVALSENSNYRVMKFGGLKTTILGGEGLVTEITGPGSVYFQTKNIPEFVDYIGIKQTSDSGSNTWRYDSNT
jgi:Mitochondrial biogenesis AIM24